MLISAGVGGTNPYQRLAAMQRRRVHRTLLCRPPEEASLTWLQQMEVPESSEEQAALEWDGVSPSEPDWGSTAVTRSSPAAGGSADIQRSGPWHPSRGALASPAAATALGVPRLRTDDAAEMLPAATLSFSCCEELYNRGC